MHYPLHYEYLFQLLWFLFHKKFSSLQDPAPISQAQTSIDLAGGWGGERSQVKLSETCLLQIKCFSCPLAPSQ